MWLILQGARACRAVATGARLNHAGRPLRRTMASSSLPPGTVAKALTWQEIKHHIESSHVELLGRTAEDLNKYREWKAQILTEWQSVDEFVLHRVFEYPPISGPTGKKIAHVPEDKAPRVVFRPNDFPYTAEAGVQHHVLWVHFCELTDTLVQDVIAKQCSHFEEVTWFRNPPHLRSIPSVDHAHILVQACPPQ
eukprot:m.258276 g.258276  ORF g.258276 m.258276 type:complete len:194 (-) comp19188_c0_seq3:2518-3099(-)